MKILTNKFGYAVLLLVLLLGSCKPEPINYTLEMRPKEKKLLVGETYKLSPRLDPYLDGATFTFKSKDTDVATVDKRGNVTAEKRGEARVYAYFQDGDQEYSCYCNIIVVDERLDILPSALNLIIGDEETVTAVMSSDTEKTLDATWSSSNTSVVTVDKDGKVKAVGEGECTIKAKAIVKDEEQTAECKVTVGPLPTVSPANLKLMVGDHDTLTCNYPNCSWESANASIASVSNGVVTAQKVGTTQVTATYRGHKAVANITVTNELAIRGADSLLVGDHTQLTTSRPNPSFSSSDPSVASVTSDGQLQALKEGTCQLSVTAGGLSGTLDIKVGPALALEETSIGLFSTMSKKLTASVSGASWSSDNTDIATVSTNGTVTKVATGTCTITARYCRQTASCTVGNATELTLTCGRYIERDEGRRMRLFAPINAKGEYSLLSNAPASAITWTSSNSSIAWVVDGAIYTGSTGGDLISTWKEATITASCDGLTATCVIVVTVPPFCYDPQAGPFANDGYILCQGNLQYRASTGAWQIGGALEMIGQNNDKISSNYSGWIDLFGKNTENNPYLSSTNSSDAGYGSNNTYAWQVLYGYDHKTRLHRFHQWDSFITNSGFSSNQWTLATIESSRGDIKGMLILPTARAGFVWPSTISFDKSKNGYTALILTASQWDTLQRAGAIFLIAAGQRNGTTIINAGVTGYYDGYSDELRLGQNAVTSSLIMSNYIGRSVRLCYPVDNYYVTMTYNN